MTTRTKWPMPPMREGTTLVQVTDTHFGQRFFTTGWMDKVAHDLNRLDEHYHGVVITGDCIDWNTPGATGYSTEDPEYLAWRTAVQATGKPYIDIPGNHDLQDHTAHNTGFYRTSDAWATAMGRADASGYVDVGHLRIIAVVPDIWRATDDGDPHESFILSSDQFTWMSSIIAATSRPIVIAAHLSPREHYGPGFSAVQPEADVATWLTAHPQVIGWLSGHQHINPDQPGTEWAQTLEYGSTTVYSINAAAAAGRMAGATVDTHQYGSCSASTFITFLDASMRTRRDRCVRSRRKLRAIPKTSNC